MECGEWNGGKRKEDFCISQFLFLRGLIKERQTFALRCLDGWMASFGIPFWRRRWEHSRMHRIIGYGHRFAAMKLIADCASNPGCSVSDSSWYEIDHISCFSRQKFIRRKRRITLVGAKTAARLGSTSGKIGGGLASTDEREAEWQTRQRGVRGNGQTCAGVT